MEIISFVFDDKQQTIEVVFREKSNAIYPSKAARPVPDKIWREIYGLTDGRIALVRRDEGKHYPAHYVDEIISFS